MSPGFGRRDSGPRSAADREAARLERERRRAEREGRPPPAEPAAHDEPPAAPDPTPEPEPERRPDPDPFAWDDGPTPRVSRRAPEPSPEKPEPVEHHDERPSSPPSPGAPPAEAEPVRAHEPEREREHEPANGNGRAPAPQPAGDPRARAWQPAVPEPAPAPEFEQAAARGDDEADEAPEAAEPQDTEPFQPIVTAQRRTVSLPRPQTETDGWDAPIGTVRVSRGGGYQAQPGASGYPPYRKLGVSKRRRWSRRIIPLLALLIVIGAAVFAYLLYQPRHGEGRGDVQVRVPEGAGAEQIGDLLAERGVVDSSFFFALRARLSGQRGELRSGRYTLERDMSYTAALTALTTPPAAAPVIDVTLPEGPSRREVARLVEQAGVRGDYLRSSRRSSKLSPRDYGAPRRTRTLEGFLFPSTYELRRADATSGRLVSRQIDAFKEAFAKVDLSRARARNLSRYDVLIIASMIEREAQVARDRRLISAVIYNRLREDIPLGIDATIRYAMNNWTRPLRVSELERDSAFNTRRRRGLPPTPIGSPGLEAMRAAADPANVDYLYYVVKPCGNGSHVFSSTDAKFQRDVAAYNRARDRRGGKDPSRC